MGRPAQDPTFAWWPLQKPSKLTSAATLMFVLGIGTNAAISADAQTATPASAKDAGAGATASVDVAAILPHPPNINHNNFKFSRNRFVLEDQSVFKIVSYAYSLNQRQIIGAPDWTRDIHYDINGTTNLTTDATVLQQQQILRQLLEQRFGLRYHREQRELSVYAIQVIKSGPRLMPAADPTLQPLEQGDGHGTQTTQTYTSCSIADFILYMQLFQDRPLVDQTGLAGRYDFKLAYSVRDAPPQDVDAPPPLFTAVQEQLGLKFRSVKAPVEVFVIDHIEQPTPN